MLFKDFIDRSCIIPDLQANNAIDAITIMVNRMCQSGAFDIEHQRDIIESLKKREELGSTAIGKHRFIPHCKTPHIKKTIGGIAISHDGFEAGAIDGQAAKVMFLLLAPPDNPGQHLRSLEHVSRQSSKDSFLAQLHRSSSVDDVWDALIQFDEECFGHREAVSAGTC